MCATVRRLIVVAVLGGLYLCSDSQASYSGGTGTVEDPYLVATPAELISVAENPDACYRLIADIDLEGERFSRAVIARFSGTFNGDGYRISHLTISGGQYLGLFGKLTSSARVENLALEGSRVTGSAGWVGALAGLNQGAIVCCGVTGRVEGGLRVGGLAGENRGHVTQCYSLCQADGFSIVGGLLGDNDGSVRNCYSAGRVSGAFVSGGLIGDMLKDGSVTNSFWDRQTSRRNWSGGGRGLSTDQMMDMQTYVDAGWDFDAVWMMPDEPNYPQLQCLSAPEVSATVGPSGGVLEVDDPTSPLFGVRLDVPPGALAEDMDMTIDKLTAAVPYASATGQAPLAIEVGPSGTQFLMPVTVTLPYAGGPGAHRAVFTSQRDWPGWTFGPEFVLGAAGDTVSFEIAQAGRYTFTHCGTLDPGAYTYYIDDAQFAQLSPEAEAVIEDVIQNGALSALYPCMGISFERTSTKSDAHLRFEYQPWLDPASPPSPCVYFIPSTGTGPHAVIRVNSDLCRQLQSQQPPQPCPPMWFDSDYTQMAGNELDFHSLIVHELSHFLGFPSQPQGQHDPAGIFETMIAPGDVVRWLVGDDQSLFEDTYPFIYMDRSPTDLISELAPTISVLAVSPCGLCQIDPASVRMEVDGSAVIHASQVVGPAEMVIAYVPTTDLTPGAHTVYVTASTTTGISVDADWAFSIVDRDADGDGYTYLGGDCDDNDPTVHPGATEVCGDGKDNDCDGEVDEEGAKGCTTYYRDDDGDGYGQTNDSLCLCEPADPYTAAQSGDCDDTDPDIHPGATEVCGDGIDQDCDGKDQPCPDASTSELAGLWHVTSMRWVGGWPINMGPVSVTFEFTEGGSFEVLMQEGSTVHCKMTGTFRTSGGKLYFNPKNASGSACDDWIILPDVAEYTLEGDELTLVTLDEDAVEFVLQRS